MRWCVLFAFAVAAFGQAGDDQRPRTLPGWPCTGKERSFDPAYAHTAEASGGHLFLFDKSEVSGFSKFALGDLRHKQTVVRAAGKLDSFADIRIPVDRSISSLFVTVTLQCMQTVLIYDPLSVGVHPDEMGGEDNWFRAGRIAIIPKPQPGVWTVRLAGMGPYFVSVQAEAASGLHNVKVSAPETGAQEWSVSVNTDPALRDPRFGLIDAARVRRSKRRRSSRMRIHRDVSRASSRPRLRASASRSRAGMRTAIPSSAWIRGCLKQRPKCTSRSHLLSSVVGF
jgi:hypothetical protein